MYKFDKFHQDTYSPPNDHFKDIPELHDHNDGDHHDLGTPPSCSPDSDGRFDV